MAALGFCGNNQLITISTLTRGISLWQQQYPRLTGDERKFWEFGLSAAATKEPGY